MFTVTFTDKQGNILKEIKTIGSLSQIEQGARDTNRIQYKGAATFSIKEMDDISWIQ